ncbi:hypothetical protein K439DRAFT_1623952 [Ramaria rubella]|nr:hypothetical protein K439DRAFT_1623952 [Ramaria rubella]
MPSWSTSKPITPNGDVRSPFAPAAIIFKNTLWVFYQSITTDRLRIVKWNGNSWEPSIPFQIKQAADWVGSNERKALGTPNLIEYDGTLHIIFTEENPSGNLEIMHYQLDAATQLWKKRVGLVAYTNAPPAVAVARDYLIAAYKGEGNRLFYQLYRDDLGWSKSWPVGNEYAWGTPAFIWLNGALNLIYSENNSGRLLNTIHYQPDDPSGPWISRMQTKEHTNWGVTAASRANGQQVSFMAFIENNGKSVYLSQYSPVSGWVNHESVGNNKSPDTPAVAVDQGTDKGFVYCLFLGDDSKREVYYTVRSVY